MKMRILPFSMSSVLLACLIAPTAAANKAKPSEPELDRLKQVLESESHPQCSSINRRETLIPTARPTTPPDPVWWQAGFLRGANEWQTYEESLVSDDDADKIADYRSQRVTLSTEPHGQWKLANWFRKHQLPDQERFHLMKVIANQDPTVNLDAVYERLGCHKIGSVWVSPEERREAMKIDAEFELSREKWETKLQLLARQLEGTRARSERAEKMLAQITAPSAVPAIVAVFCTSSPSLAEHGINVLGQISEFQSSRALAGQAVFSPWKAVRSKAIKLLAQRKLEEFVPDLLLILSNPVRTKLEIAYQVNPRRLQPIPLITDLRMNWDYVWVEESRDTIRVGIRRLFPISAPAEMAQVSGSIFQTPIGTDGRTNGLGRIERTSVGAALIELVDQAGMMDASADRLNETRIAINERVGVVLSQCVGEPMSAEPNQWWEWWAEFSNSPGPDQKYVLIVDERKKQPDLPSFSSFNQVVTPRSCLIAGTPVWTETGPVAVEKIQAGDRVLSKDVETGELKYKVVLQTTVRAPTPVHSFRVGDESIVASPGHHFWVSGEGWTKVRELVSDYPLHTVTGMQRVSEATDEGRIEAVYNLVVADFHTYFVGNSMILSHDVLPPRLTNVKIPGMGSR